MENQKKKIFLKIKISVSILAGIQNRFSSFRDVDRSKFL
jgi:hypothetical protein